MLAPYNIPLECMELVIKLTKMRLVDLIQRLYLVLLGQSPLVPPYWRRF